MVQVENKTAKNWKLTGFLNPGYMWSVNINDHLMRNTWNYIPRTFENVKCEIGNSHPLTAKGFYKNFSFVTKKPKS